MHVTSVSSLMTVIKVILIVKDLNSILVLLLLRHARIPMHERPQFCSTL